MTRLAGKRAVVTGASRGIGRAIARALGKAGCELAICALDDGRLDETRAELAAGGKVIAEHCDVAAASDVAHFCARVERELGVPDILVLNAGVVERTRLDEMTESQWDRVIDVNLKGAFLLLRALLPKMRERRAGRIILIGSISGTMGTPKLTAYCASKHAIIGLGRALAEELRDDGIVVNIINPGSVDTDMLRGSGFTPDLQPEQVADVALYLAADAPAVMTGSSLDIFG